MNLKMHLRVGALAVLGLALAACGGASVSPQQAEEPISLSVPTDDWQVGDSHIVVLEDGLGEAAEIATALLAPFGIEPTFVYGDALQGFAAPIPPAAVPVIAADPRVKSIEPDFVWYINPQTIPPGMDRIDADLSPTANYDGVDDPMDVDVAILDTGMSMTHPDLDIVPAPRSVSFIASEPTPEDGHGHGSHVGGTVGAIDNGIGVIGVAPGARLWAVKICTAGGSCPGSAIIAGINHVTSYASEVEVVNMSIGGGGYCGGSNATRTAIQGSIALGVVYVVAAGNSNRDIYGSDGLLCGVENGVPNDYGPASIPEVLTVSAMYDNDGTGGGAGPGNDDGFTGFTNYSTHVAPGNPVTSSGAAVDLAAPGQSILSTHRNNGYATMSGTSMASPHVAGGVALYIAANGRASNAAEVFAIMQAVIDAGEPQPWRPGGSGDKDTNLENLLDVASFVTLPPPPPPPTTGPVVTIIQPTDLSTSILGNPVTFEATAIDAEDGDISAALSWNSTLDGAIGTGATFVAILSEGYHEITASVTDSDGNTGSDMVRHVVIPPVPNDPPGELEVTIVTDQPGYANGDLVTITVTATLGGAPAVNASVRFAIVTPNQTVLQDFGSTDANGQYIYQYTANTGVHGPGTHQAGAQVTLNTTQSGYDTTTYMVF